MRSFVLASLGVLQIMIAPAQACIGSVASVRFAKADGDALIVQMRDSRTGETRELKDDVGLLGVHLALLKLQGIARGNQGRLNPRNERAIFSFISARVGVFEKVIKAQVPSAQARPILESLAGFYFQLIGDADIDFKQVEKRYQRLQQVMKEQGVNLQVAVREPGARSFGAEVDLPVARIQSLDAPVTRSIGCSGGLAEFNTEIGAGGPVESLPSFDVRQ